MPVRAKLDVKGLDEYVANILQAGRDIDEVAAKAINAAADILFVAVEESARPLRDSGEMENTISRSEVQRDGNFTFAEVAVDPDGEIPYEVFVEFGTSDTPARGFFRAAIDHGRSKVRTAIRSVFKAEGMAD